MTHNQTNEPGGIEALLPWYAKGSLSATEMRQVEAYLADHPEARGMLALIREELDETVAANESLGVPSAAARDRLMASIAADSGAGETVPSLWQRVKAGWAALLPQGMSPGYALGGAFAGLVILLQAAALSVMIAGQSAQGPSPKLASGQENSAKTGTFVLVRFTDNAKAGDIQSLLQPLSAVIVDGPKSNGFFKLRIADKTLNEADRAAIIAKLRERSDIVSFVSPAG